MEMKPKFKINEKVKFINDPDSDAGNVVSIIFDGKSYCYRISVRDLDLNEKKIVEGFKTCLESELLSLEVTGEVTE